MYLASKASLNEAESQLIWFALLHVLELVRQCFLVSLQWHHTASQAHAHYTLDVRVQGLALFLGCTRQPVCQSAHSCNNLACVPTVHMLPMLHMCTAATLQSILSRWMQAAEVVSHWAQRLVTSLHG